MNVQSPGQRIKSVGLWVWQCGPGQITNSSLELAFFPHL